MNKPPPPTGARYRTIESARIAGILLARGWPFTSRHGEHVRAGCEANTALDRLVTLGLPHAASAGGEPLFDPVEVINFLVWSGLNGSDSTLSQLVMTARRLAWETFGAETDLARPPALTVLGPRRYAVSICRTFDVGHKKAGEKIRLRLPLPFEDETLADLAVDALPFTQPADIVRAADRLDIVTTVPAGKMLDAGVRVSFTCRTLTPTEHGAVLSATDTELYTRPSEGLIKASEKVRELASRVGGTNSRPGDRLRQFWSFIMENLVCGAIHYDRLDPSRPLDTVLDEGWYDCRAGSALMAALCRASQIPARLISGYLLSEAAPTWHTWLECWIDSMGWVPFDLFFSVDDVPAWRDFFFGQLNYRMAVERLPRLFSGTGDVRLPAAWHMVTALDGRGTSVEYRTLDNRALIYKEHVEVACENDATAQ